jgi:hypothetical protein
MAKRPSPERRQRREHAVSRRSPDSDEPWVPPVAVAGAAQVGMDSQRCGSCEVRVNSPAAWRHTKSRREGDRRLMPGGAGYGAERETDG